MKKLKLLMDDLQVETFHTDPAAGGGDGTVEALQQTTWYPTRNLGEPQCDQPSNRPFDASCYDSCDGGGNCTNVCNTGAMVCETGNCPTGPFACYSINYCP